MNNSYLRFLQIISQTTTHLQLNKDLSPTAIFLLNEIAVKDFEGQPLIVSQAMEFDALGSPATLYRKIYELHEAGLIEVTNVGTDRRTKYLFLTQAAKDYFQFFSDSMLKAVLSR